MPNACSALRSKGFVGKWFYDGCLLLASLLGRVMTVGWNDNEVNEGSSSGKWA